MNVKEAVQLLRARGALLATGKGKLLCLAEAIVGEPIRGSWWAHPKSRKIFAVLRELRESPEVLVCRLIDGKITLIHRRLWPALVKLADQFDCEQLAQIHEEHTPAGHHVARESAFPGWVPREVRAESRRMNEEEAYRVLANAGILAAPRRTGSSTPSRRRSSKPARAAVAAVTHRRRRRA